MKKQPIKFYGKEIFWSLTVTYSSEINSVVERLPASDFVSPPHEAKPRSTRHKPPRSTNLSFDKRERHIKREMRRSNTKRTNSCHSIIRCARAKFMDRMRLCGEDARKQFKFIFMVSCGSMPVAWWWIFCTVTIGPLDH